VVVWWCGGGGWIWNVVLFVCDRVSFNIWFSGSIDTFARRFAVPKC
jgi:hypothetical protein